jgi:L-arabinonolactonase
MRLTVVTETKDILGECPLWHEEQQRLYWVDAFAPAIRRLDPATGAVESFAMPTDIGSFVFCGDGTLIGGMRGGYHHIDLAAGKVTLVANPVARHPRLMLNDGKCDRRGRYWCASVHSDFVGREAEIFRLDPDLSVHRMDGGFVIGNGIAFSPDDRLMYFADSRDDTVWIYDLEIETGAIANRRRFFSTADIDGRVDGATCDSEGNYWCALVHGGAVGCIAPDGRLIERIPVPARHPTMVGFGGPALTTLYVTTATRLLPPDERAAWPEAGKVFAIEGLCARGIPEPRFTMPRKT